MASSGFQLTASINYILPLSLMMYAIAPIFLSINSGDKLIATKLSRPGLLLLPLTALLNEQIGFVVAIILVTFLSIKYVQSKKIDWTLVTVLGVMSVILIWVTIAKGNDMRFASSVEYWYPNFIKIGLMGRLKVYLIWLFTSLFVKLNSLMIVAALIISPFVYKRSDMSLKRMLLLAFLLVPILAPLLNNGYSDQFYPILQKMLYTFDFRGVYKSIGGGLPIYGGKLIFIVSTYVFWSAYLSILLIHLYKNLRRIILVVPVVAALASMAIFIFSPTLFGSGSRILLAPAVMILTCLIPLFIKAPKEIRVAVYIFALVNFANLLSLWAVSGYHSIY